MTARLWAWPAVSGELTPPGPALYLTWPAWENYRLNALGEDCHPFLTPVFLPDPPNFLASLNALLAIASEGGPYATQLPFTDQETVNLKNRLLGRVKTYLGADHLILALAHIARLNAQDAHDLVQEALANQSDLYYDLTEAAGAPVGQANPDDPPDPSPRMARSWLTLARPYLRAGDLLWPAYGVRPEFSPLAGLEPDAAGLFAWPGSA
ncbi:MAG: hypothetical protein LBI10_12910 [Deltaproteobacteria bacterium]|jgi:hypothetical protein|nr:hypothetical protein [Deltaproteobacteria bacterium]